MLCLDLQSLPTHVSEADQGCGVFWSLAKRNYDIVQHYAHITYNYLSTCTVIFSSNLFLPKRGLNVFPLVDHQLPSSQTQITWWTVHHPAPPSPTGFISNHPSQLPTVQYRKVAADPKSWKAPGLTHQFIQTLTILMSQTGKISTRIYLFLVRGLLIDYSLLHAFS